MSGNEVRMQNAECRRLLNGRPSERSAAKSVVLAAGLAVYTIYHLPTPIS